MPLAKTTNLEYAAGVLEGVWWDGPISRPRPDKRMRLSVKIPPWCRDKRDVNSTAVRTAWWIFDMWKERGLYSGEVKSIRVHEGEAEVEFVDGGFMSVRRDTPSLADVGVCRECHGYIGGMLAAQPEKLLKRGQRFNSFEEWKKALLASEAQIIGRMLRR